MSKNQEQMKELINDVRTGRLIKRSYARRYRKM